MGLQSHIGRTWPALLVLLACSSCVATGRVGPTGRDAAQASNGGASNAGAGGTDPVTRSDASPPDAARDAGGGLQDGPKDLVREMSAERDGTPDVASASSDGSAARADVSGEDGRSSGRGIPVAGPWVSFYGSPTSATNVDKIAAAFRVVNLDADPDVGFTPSQISTLRANGANRVLSYMNVGSCESFRSYWSADPSGHKSCQGSGGLTDPYFGFADEMWVNLSSAAYQDLIVNYVAPRLAAQGIDGFFLDNMEVLEHGLSPTQGGPCDTTCVQGGFDLIWQLRQRFPSKLIVMQNAVSAKIRSGTSHGVAVSDLLDGVSVEGLFDDGTTQRTDSGTLTQLMAWQALHLAPGGSPFWIGSLDYVGSCSADKKPLAVTIQSMAAQLSLSEYVSDLSSQLHAPCFWSDFP